MGLKKTSLYNEHIKLNAKMAPFADYDMPLQYSSAKDEVLAVREGVGIFDVSHMGEFFAEGPGAHDFVDFIMTNDFKNAGNNKAVYSPICRENGTIIDDHISYKINDQKVLICVNAANIEKDWNWLKSHVGKFNCTLTNKSNDYSLLAVQGPKSENVLRKLRLISAEDFPYYSVLENTRDNEQYIISRTGYTGEDGVEIFCSHDFANKLWKEFLNEGVTPCGLVSRDILRLEVCFPLYGNELTDDITPLDSALKWTVKLKKDNFVGRNFLAEYSPKFRLAKLSIEKGIPRPGYPVLNKNNEVIGNVTSGTMSPTLNKGIALALIEKEKFPENKEFVINIRNKQFNCTYHAKHFYKGGHK
ncbi:MAG: glycine cleavage system aminomethyltransferase GcvT [Bacteriovoracaceae bacterium]|nr:glycine cleavage system aminomethyltransferase GcvT [Bacteriovoracaceae bacterium]